MKTLITTFAFLTCSFLGFGQATPVQAIPLNIPPTASISNPVLSEVWFNTNGSLSAETVTLDAPLVVSTVNGRLHITAPPSFTFSVTTWTPFTLATTQPTDGSQVWCLSQTTYGTTPLNSMNLALVDEVRATTTNAYDLINLIQPVPPTTAGTVPAWNKGATACSGNPSLVFPSNTLTTGETRVGVKGLVSY